MTTKLNTNQFATDNILMNLISTPSAERARLCERICATRTASGIDEYIVELKINGIEVNWSEFSVVLNNILDEMVIDAARELIRKDLRVDDLADKANRLAEDAEDLGRAVACRLRIMWDIPNPDGGER
jgi:hypothetical protein